MYIRGYTYVYVKSYMCTGMISVNLWEENAELLWQKRAHLLACHSTNCHTLACIAKP